MPSRFQFGLRQLLVSTAWFAVALGALAYSFRDSSRLASNGHLRLLLFLIPGALGGGVGALFGKAAAWATVTTALSVAVAIFYVEFNPYLLWITVLAWPISFGATVGALFGKPWKGAFYGALPPTVLLIVFFANGGGWDALMG